MSCRPFRRRDPCLCHTCARSWPRWEECTPPGQRTSHLKGRKTKMNKIRDWTGSPISLCILSLEAKKSFKFRLVMAFNVGSISIISIFWRQYASFDTQLRHISYSRKQQAIFKKNIIERGAILAWFISIFYGVVELRTFSFLVSNVILSVRSKL